MAEQDTTQEQPDATEGLAASTTYPGTGEQGQTTPDNSRTGEADARVTAYGDCEEAGALVGVAIASATELPAPVVRLLARVQNDLVDVSADLGGSLEGHDVDDSAGRIDAGYVERLERACEHFSAELSQPPGPVLSGGTGTAAALHHARVVVRRAERATRVALDRDPDRTNPLTSSYLDSLARLLLILARSANVEHGDTVWQPGLSARLDGIELWEPFPEPEE
ncbi:MAG: ATP:cob(I)alamin adenosyltransferase [Nocardioidaceae bacterium]